MRQLNVVFVFFIAIFWLAGCSSTTTSFTGTSQKAPAEVAQAIDILADASTRNSTDLALLWAQDYLQQQEPGNAQKILDTIDSSTLRPAQKLAWYRVQAQTYLGLEQNRKAIILLDERELSHLLKTKSARTAAEYLLLQADAYALQGNYTDSLDIRFAIADDLTSADKRYNEEFIWALLNQLNDDQLANYARSNDANTAGWAELASIYRDRSLGVAGQVSAIKEWQNEWRQHPAYSNLPEAVATLSETSVEQPNQVAVLLPESGPLARAALAIREGIMTAYYSAESNGELVPSIKFYDTANRNIEDVHAEAEAQGASFIIGPLEKDKVNRLAEQPTLRTTTLALNYASEDNPVDGLYQFALAPEDEARQVAELAYANGLRGAGVITPSSALGKRLAQTFNDTWRELGGQVVAQESYGHDISNAVSRLMGVSNEAARSGSSHRAGLDVIFLVGNPDQARQLKPAIDFYQGNRLPIYATSHIYSGRVDIHLDEDLNRIRFVELPWLLNPNSQLASEAKKHSPQSHGQFEAVFAMGIDAFTLSRELLFIAEGEGSKISGQTGDLLLRNQRIVRVLQPAQFRRGRVIAEERHDTVPSYRYDAAPSEQAWPSRRSIR